MYRLTLVKAWNTEEIKNYAELVSRGRPDFIEVKVRNGLKIDSGWNSFLWRALLAPSYDVLAFP